MRLGPLTIATLLLAACSRTGLRVPPIDRDASVDARLDAAVTGTCADPHDDALAPPRPIAPISTSFVTSHEPTLRWELAPGSDGVCLDICRDRACTDRIESRTLSGDNTRTSASLAIGVYFWRLRSHRPGDAGTHASPTWEFTVGAEDAPIDTAWGSRIDLDGDGFGDLVANAAQYGGRAGRLYVFHGSRNGLEQAPSWTLEAPDGPQSAFGTTFGSAGDVDGDGFGDLVVGASRVNGGEGRAYVFFGGETAPTNRFVTISPPAGLMGFGIAADGIGDIDADGYGDFAIGQDPDQDTAGQLFVYRGGPARDGAVVSQTLHGDGDSFEGFGIARAAGDIDGDRFADVIVPAGNFSPDRGRVYVFRGSREGLVRDRVIGLNGLLRGYFGDGAPAGDVNGDGFADIVVGASGTSLFSGYVEVYTGSSTGLSTMPIVTLGDTGEPYGFLTGDLAGIGDVNRDGFDDFAVGGSVGNDERGRLRVFYGSAAGPRASDVTELVPSSIPFAHFGQAFSRPNDFDRDGSCDLGAGIGSTPAQPGQVLVYTGTVGMHLGSAPAVQLANPTATDDGFAWSLR